MAIYCDESGFTGNDLLQEQQPWFVYAALNIDEDEAVRFRDKIKSKYYLQGEIKGKNLVKSGAGQKALRLLYEEYAPKVRIIYHHKKYALSAKYFEYVFEPVISSHNSFFYRMEFNKFIAHLVFSSFEPKKDDAENIYLKFQELLRGNDWDGLFALLRSSQMPNPLVELVATFTLIHKERILEEITTNGEIDYWILDLAQNGLYDLLRIWSVDAGLLKVICDESKPLKDAVSRIPNFSVLNQELRFWDPLGKGPTPINFSISEPIQFASSKDCAGLQLADLFASSAAWSLNNPSASFSKFIDDFNDTIFGKTRDFCVAPEPGKFLIPGTRRFEFNIMALNRLTQFSSVSPDNAGTIFMDFLKEGVKLVTVKR